MQNTSGHDSDNFLASEKVQSFLASLSSLFSEEYDLRSDHPALPLVKNDFETYQAIMQDPMFRCNSTALVEFFQKGLQIFPEQRELYLSIADMLELNGRYMEAIGYLNHALALSLTLDVLLRRTKAQIAAGLLEGAEASLQHLLAATADQPELSEAKILLAQIKLLHGDRIAALGLLNLDMPLLSSGSRIIQSRILFENALFSRAHQVLEGVESDAGIERLRMIEQLLLAPLCRELHAYARRPDADRYMVALIQRRFDKDMTNALVPEELEIKSLALSSSGDIDGALLCDRLLMVRHTGLGNVEPVRSRIVSKLDMLGKLRSLPKVPIRTTKTRILAVMGTTDQRHPIIQMEKVTGSLRYCDFVEPSFFYLLDEINQSSLLAANRKLIDYCCALQPELIVTAIYLELLTETLSELKNMGIPIVLDCHDVWADRMHYVEKNLGNISFGVTSGTYDFYQSMVSQPEKLFSSPGVTFHPNLSTPIERDIPVSFIGTSNPIYSPVRMQALDFLQSRGIEVLHLGGYAGGGLLTDEEYCSYIARSRIVLNFSETMLCENTFTYRTLKGRTIEALTAGALLLESYSNDTARWFTQGRHYDTFSSHYELESKLRMYLGDDALRQSVAAEGHAFFMENYYLLRIWSAIIDMALAEV